MRWIDYTRGTIVWHMMIIMMRGIERNTAKFFKIPCYKHIFMSDKTTIWFRSDKKELDKVAYSIIEETKDDVTRKKHFDLFKDYLKKNNKVTDKIMDINLSKLEDKELANIYDELLEIEYLFHGVVFQSIDAINIKLEELIIDKLRDYMKQKGEFTEPKLTDEYGALITPDVLSFVNKEELMILELAAKKLDPEQLKKQAHKIIDIYWWVPLGWERSDPRNVDMIIDKISKIKDPNKEIKKIKQRTKDAKDKKQQLSEKYDFEDEMKHLLSLFEDYTIFHDYRKEGQMKSNYIFFRINDELGKRNNIDPQLLDCAYPEEIQELLKKGNIDVEELKNRKKGIFYHSEGREDTEFYSGDTALKMIKEELSSSEENIDQFSGFTASLGVATGKAKICPGVKDAEQKMQKGDILVTGMTTPDFVPFMKKAAAIVTNEGGATSHAGIISREFGIPCIVGTKIATRVLKDDDLVEVDANHNIIKKIR